MAKVKDWSEHQHYKDRNPPWIKLKTNTFQNYEFSKLDDTSKLLAICIWTIAARSGEGEFPLDLDYIKGQCNIKDAQPKHLKQLMDKGFIEDSELLAECTQKISESVSVSPSASVSQGGAGGNFYSDEFEEFWRECPPSRGSKKEASKSYEKARKRVDHETIIRGIKGYAADIRRNPRPIDKIAHPTTWLNQERWTVDYDIELAAPRAAPIKGSRESDPLLMGTAIAMRRAMEADNSGRQDEIFER